MSEQPGARARKRTIEPVKLAATYPPPCDPSDIYALQAVHHGRATPEQQTRAVDFVLTLCTMKLDPANPDSTNATYLALGRQQVGRTIYELLAVRVNPRGEHP